MSKIRLNGTTSGYTEIAPPAVAGDNTVTLPSSNGSANQFLKNGSTAGTLGWSSMVETATGVGIETSSPEQPLTIGSSRPLNFAANIDALPSISTASSLIATTGGGGSGIFSEFGSLVLASRNQAATDSQIAFFTGTQERARITSNGDFLSNTTDINPVTNDVSGVALRVSGNILTNVQSVNAPHQFRRNTDGDLIRFHNNSTTDCGAVRVTGQQTFFDSTSDYRLKENVVSLNNAIARVMQLAPKQFNFIGDPANTFDGFLAHEVQAVVPMCASGEKDAVDEDGNPEYQGVDQSKLVPLLTAALQEALDKIASLEARITALEAA